MINFMQKKNNTTMEEPKNKLTKTVDNYEISDTLSTFRHLDLIRKEQSISVDKICEKINIKKSAYYRYCSEYKSQKASQPSMSLLTKYADLFDYKITLIKRYK